MIEPSMTGPGARGRSPEPRDLVHSLSRGLRALEIVGSGPGLTVKQLARRLEMNPGTAYHLIRTLVYEGYLLRDEAGRYSMGPAVAYRFREMARALRGPDTVTAALRRAVADTGYSHFLARFVGGRVAITAVVEGPHSPWLEELVPGFDDAAHATAIGKALLATLQPHQRANYLHEAGMRRYTDATLTEPAALDADLAAGLKRGMQVEIGQFRPGVACAAVPVVSPEAVESRTVLACALPIRDMMHSAKQIRSQLQAAAINLMPLLS